MYIYKKNIILVPADYDGVSMAKGILSLDCYADKTICNLRTYNIGSLKNLTLGISINKKLNKINLNGSKLNSDTFELNSVLGNADNVSVVLLNIKENSYDIVLWGSTELNSTWRSTLEFMLEDEFKTQQNNFVENINFKEQQVEKNSLNNNLFDIKDNFQNKTEDCDIDEFINNAMQNESQKSPNKNLVQDDFINSNDLLKNQNLDDFLDSVISLEQDDDNVIYDENSSHLEENKTDQNTFYDRISYQIEKMFASNEQEKLLDEIIPNSKFCRVEFDDKTGHYVFGIVYESAHPKYLCYGVPAKKDSKPPKELSGFYQWLPVDVENDSGDGYYMMYQDALTGKNISVEII